MCPSGSLSLNQRLISQGLSGLKIVQGPAQQLLKDHHSKEAMSNALGSVTAQLVMVRAPFSGLRACGFFVMTALAVVFREICPALQADCHWFDPGIAS